MHLEIRKKADNYYGVFRTSYRKDGKVLHKNHGTLWNMPYDTLKLIKLSIQNNTIPKTNNLVISKSKEYGASCAFLKMAHNIGLATDIYSRPSEQWVKDVLAMVVGRIIYAGSKLALSNTYKDSALWQLCGVAKKVNVEKHCYKSMDKLLERQGAIQKKLARRHLTKNRLIMYDITSSYLEGAYKDSEIVLPGHNRDHKSGHEQICIGLLCNEQGCPVAVEVFPGNTKDSSTVIEKIGEIKKSFGIDEFIFVGDRGMITTINYDKLKDDPHVFVITALTHRQIDTLLQKKIIQIELFGTKDIVEIVDPEDPRKRYCLCNNPVMGEKESKVRWSILKKLGASLTKCASAKRRRKAEIIGKRVGKILGKTNMEQFILWQVVDGRLQWSYNMDAVGDAEKLDGCYIIQTNAPTELVKQGNVVDSYKNLQLVEQAFRQLKTVVLEMRPYYHKNDDRIKAHVFICMLSFYLLWHIRKKTDQLLHQEKNTGRNRFWTIDNIIERLKSIRQNQIKIQGVCLNQVTTPDEDQQKILDLLDVTM